MRSRGHTGLRQAPAQSTGTLSLPDKATPGNEPSMTGTPWIDVRLPATAIRLRDTLIFQAPSVVGVAFVFPGPTAEALVRTGWFLLGGFLLMAHIFAFNDWSDRASDAEGSRRELVKREARHDGRDGLLLAVGLGVAALGILAWLSLALLWIGGAILLLGVAYSFPVLRFKGKGIPLLSSLLHISGTVLTFLMGTAVFSPIVGRSLLIGGYFALIITAGHLVQEIQDVAGDRSTAISTNAVRFGPRQVFWASSALFALSFVYLLGLALAQLIPTALAVLVVFLPIYAYLAWRTLRGGLSPERVRRFRGQYRVLFGLLTAAMAFWTLVA